MRNFLFLAKYCFQGKSLTRGLLDIRLKQEFLSGSILDLGAGHRDLYGSFIPRKEGSVFSILDVKQGVSIDFEKDPLPYQEHTFDVVLLLNVLEHLFNYTQILREIVRIKKSEGALIGFVPFLKWYHKDPHDYFRYTDEALERILKESGYTDVVIEVIYNGPYTTAYEMIATTLPRVLRPFVFTFAYIIDGVFSLLRKNAAKRYALGYYFVAK